MKINNSKYGQKWVVYTSSHQSRHSAIPAFVIYVCCVMASQRSPTIIIDNGSGFVKAGFSGDKQFPTVTLPCGDVLVGQFVLDVEQEGKLPTVNVDCLKEVSRSNILYNNKFRCLCALTISLELYFQF